MSGEYFVCCGYRFEVLDMDRHRVDKVLIVGSPTEEGEANEGADET